MEITLKNFCKWASTSFLKQYGLISYQINYYNDHQCRKSIPASIMESRPEVAAVWKIGQQLWIRNYEGVYDAIRGFNWNAEIQEFIASFEGRKVHKKNVGATDKCLFNYKHSRYSSLLGIYRLGDSWYPVEAGDAIWMPPFVFQW